MRLFKIKENEIAPGFNRGLSSNLWWLRNTNHVRFIEECVMCMGKLIFVKKMFTNGLKTQQSIELKHVDDKEKVLDTAVSKEGHADILLGHNTIYSY